jgi:chromosome segregation ATPase
MKMKVLPKAPIQIQRDNLILELEQIKSEIIEKNNIITALQDNIKQLEHNNLTKSQTIINYKNQIHDLIESNNKKDNKINELEQSITIDLNNINILKHSIKNQDSQIQNLSIENSVKSNELKLLESNSIIKENTLKDQLFEHNNRMTEKVVLLEGSIRFLNDIIETLKTDKEDLKLDKIRLIQEIEQLKVAKISFEEEQDISKASQEIGYSQHLQFEFQKKSKIFNKGNTVDSIFPDDSDYCNQIHEVQPLGDQQILETLIDND